MARWIGEPQHFNILRLKSKLTGPVLAYVRSDFDEKRLMGIVRNVRRLSESGEYSVFSAQYRGEHINFLGTGSGPASLLTALFELSPRNLTSILRIGACGGLSGTSINRVILSEGSLCKDRISSKLSRARHVRADGRLVEAVAASLSNAGLEYVRGLVASTDAMYLFERDLKKAQRQGACCWDLETATALAFGKAFTVPTASLLLAVSDAQGNSLRSYPPIKRLDFVKSTLNALTPR